MTDSGYIYTAGFFSETVDFTPGIAGDSYTSAGDFDIFVQKLDTNGNVQWVRVVGGSGKDFAIDIGVDATDSVYTMGNFQDSVDFDPGPASTILSASIFDLFVQKLDSTGDFVWSKATSGTVTYSQGIATTPLGNIHLTGGFTGTVDFDPGVDTFNLSSDLTDNIFITKWSLELLQIVYVDFANGNPTGTGEENYPVDSVSIAMGRVQPNGTIRINTGSSTETLTLTDPVTLEKFGSTGTVIIGDAATP